ncbi:unnamed protein product [Phaedon cochleariae]|uniref:Reverse transcriptase domain-containing protein n=1 Tax=Phaedon cochleariae TaxID=80249 RepID=A0A9N9SM42_PHACE|nr:unnamed protein product [Phaedon cochleariae]
MLAYFAAVSSMKPNIDSSNCILVQDVKDVSNDQITMGSSTQQPTEESLPTSTSEHAASATTQHNDPQHQPPTLQQQQQQQPQPLWPPLPLLEQTELDAMHAATIPPYQFWNSEFRNKQPAFIRFNFTLPWGANFAVYGRRNVAPSVTQYDFVEFVKGGRVDHRLRRKRDINEGTLDLTKAFELINHEILLQKLQHYGVRGKANDLMKSYLSNRTQIVGISSENNSKSSTYYSDSVQVGIGVPQGSILGPILFLIFINDICSQIDISSVFLFADDISVVVSERDIGALNETSNTTVSRVVEWCENNSLVINKNKTNYLFFKNHRKDTLHIDIYNSRINATNSVRFLGVMIDEDLRWTDQVRAIMSKLASA